MARGLDGDVVVFLEVDSGVLLRRVVGGTEELALNAGVGGARHVLAILPSTVSRASSLLASRRAGIPVGIKVVMAAAAAATAVVPVVVAGRAAPVGTLLEAVVAVDQLVTAKSQA